MTTHLPECYCFPYPIGVQDCICDRLRACEQRATADTLNRLLDAGNVMAQEFYDKGVQAARDAVDNATVRGQHRAWVFADLLELVPDDPEPLICAVCGEPVAELDGVLRHAYYPLPVEHQGHAATLTPPEPPAGTPVWWDGKWWWRKLWSDGPDEFYSCAVPKYSPRTWEQLPGAIPASIPEGGTA